MYWATFLLNWIVLPFLMEYLASGDFTPKERFMRALKNNIPILIVYLVLFIVVVIVLAVTESGREALRKYLFPLNPFSEGIVGCIIGLGLVFGLLSIIVLLGYGLVEIPLQYLKYASTRRCLRYLQYKTADFEARQRLTLDKVQELINLSHLIKVKQENEVHRKVILSDVESF